MTYSIDLRGMPLKVVDLFSGAGGMSLGFQNAGFEVVAGLDNWKPAIETYSVNFAHPVHSVDLSDLSAGLEILKPYFVDGAQPGIIGCPPCQDFSSAGKRSEGPRADLTIRFAEYVAELQPPFFVMENVPLSGLSEAFEHATEIFQHHGYQTGSLVFNTAWCGVPQRRRRRITLGFKNSQILGFVLTQLMCRTGSTEVTVRDWLGGKLDADFYYMHPRSYQRRAVFSVDEPAPTLRGVNRPIPPNYVAHPGDAAPIEQARALTTSERAALQTFPDDYKFVGAKTNIEQLIGNSVPPKFAEYIAAVIYDALHR